MDLAFPGLPAIYSDIYSDIFLRDTNSPSNTAAKRQFF